MNLNECVHFCFQYLSSSSLTSKLHLKWFPFFFLLKQVGLHTFQLQPFFSKLACLAVSQQANTASDCIILADFC